MQIGDLYKHKITGNVFILTWIGNTIVKGLNKDKPKREFYFRMIDNMQLIRKENLIKYDEVITNRPSEIKQIQINFNLE